MEEDEYITYKIRLKDIVKNNDCLEIINNLCYSHNLHKAHVSQFLRLYILNCYHNNKEIPNIDMSFLKMIFNIFSLQKERTTENKIYLELLNFYKEEHKPLNENLKINSVNQSKIIDCSIKAMIVNIKVNISFHFEKHLNKFINNMFIDEIKQKIDDYKKINPKTYKQYKNNLFKELNKFKNDVLNCNNVEGIYLEWFNKIKKFILPENFKSFDELKTNPYSFLKPMIFMNLELEKKNKKLFQIIPLKNGYNLGYITFETATLVDALVNNDNINLIVKDKNNKYVHMVKNNFNNAIRTYQKDIWNYFFKTNLKIFKNKKKYTFNYTILTDGVGASIRFIENKHLIKSNKHKDNQLKARKNLKIINENLTEEEIKNNKNIKENEHKEKLKKNLEKQKLYKKIMKLEYKIEENKTLKNLETFDELKKEYFTKYNLNYLHTKKEKEFKYLEELNDKELNKVKNNYIVIDPGKRKLLQMLDNNKRKYLSYSNHQRTKEINSNNHKKSLLHLKKINNITDIELELSKYSCKSCNINTYKQYLSINNRNYVNLMNIYKNSKCRVHKWYRYVNTRRSESNLINNIKKSYGKNINVFIGDWSNGNTQMKNFKSTPRIGLKRVLKQYFNVYDLDEFRTSKMSCMTHKETKNLYLDITKKYDNEAKHKHVRQLYGMSKKFKNQNNTKIIKKKSKYLNDKKIKINRKKNYEKKIIKTKIIKTKIKKIKNENKLNKLKKIKNENKFKKMHAVLSYQMTNKRKGCINRDKNSCLNMLNIVEQYLKDKTRPLYLSRKIKICN